MPARKIFWSFRNAGLGLWQVWRGERNMRLHVAAAFAVFYLTNLISLARWERVAVAGAVFLVLILETLNTAIEAAVDLVTTAFHPLAAKAKNVAAGAVLLATINALLLAYYIFWPHLGELGRALARQASASPWGLGLAAFILLFLLVAGWRL